MLNHFEACAPTSLQHHWSEGNHPQGQRVNEVVGRFQIGELTTVFFYLDKTMGYLRYVQQPLVLTGCGK